VKKRKRLFLRPESKGEKEEEEKKKKAKK